MTQVSVRAPRARWGGSDAVLFRPALVQYHTHPFVSPVSRAPARRDASLPPTRFDTPGPFCDIDIHTSLPKANYPQARPGLPPSSSASVPPQFHLSVPPSSPSSINVGNRLTQIRYEVRASVGVAWDPEYSPANVQPTSSGDTLSYKTMIYTPGPRQNVWSSASDKIWAQARVLGGMPMAGESACIESSRTIPGPYAAPDAYLDPYLNHNPSASPSPHLPTSMSMLYAERAQSPLYIYPMTPPLALPLPSAPAPLHGPLISPPYRAHDGQLWFPPAPPAYIGDPSYGQPPPHQPESDNPALYRLRSPRLDCPFPAHPITCSVLSLIQQQQQYPPQQTIGHGTLYHITSAQPHAPAPSRRPLPHLSRPRLRQHK
ncbi:hypothetical protein EDB84DRAFT_1569922 [Lactarius hengduanensis]|nr:hypothetical protein EDB84DRAFT_1569922 [Lactarius hengduanensis]